MQPAYVFTGTPGQAFEQRVGELLAGHAPTAVIKESADYFELHKRMKAAPVDLLIGNTYGKLIARAEDVPFVRFGFPILDRAGHRCFPTLGYAGAMRLIEKMSDALLEHQDRHCAEERFELVE